jgi:hypothetical protein
VHKNYTHFLHKSAKKMMVQGKASHINFKNNLKWKKKKKQQHLDRIHIVDANGDDKNTILLCTLIQGIGSNLSRSWMNATCMCNAK